MFTKLKQFKDLRSQAKELQGKLSQESVTTRAAGGNVMLTLDGNLTMTALMIAPELLTADKQTRLQDAIKEAHNDAVKKMQRIMAMRMKEMGGLPQIPGLT